MSKKQLEKFILQHFFGGCKRKQHERYKLIGYKIYKQYDSPEVVHMRGVLYKHSTWDTLHKQCCYCINVDNLSFMAFTIEKGRDELVNTLNINGVKFETVDDACLEKYVGELYVVL